MITQNQIQDLSDFFQIDKFTIFREYLQLVFLSYLYQEKEAENLVFKGGTALRFFFGSPRFSEDLDFSTPYKDKDVHELLKRLETKLKKEFPGLTLTQIYSGKEGIRYKFGYKPPDFKYPFNLRLDFHRVDEIKNKQTSALTTLFPVMIFPQVFHLSGIGILEEKLQALQTRGKGRDIFDLWFLLSKGTDLPVKGINREKIIKKIMLYPQAELEKDLGKFLPKGQKMIIPSLKKDIVKMILSSDVMTRV